MHENIDIKTWGRFSGGGGIEWVAVNEDRWIGALWRGGRR